MPMSALPTGCKKCAACGWKLLVCRQLSCKPAAEFDVERFNLLGHAASFPVDSRSIASLLVSSLLMLLSRSWLFFDEFVLSSRCFKFTFSLGRSGDLVDFGADCLEYCLFVAAVAAVICCAVCESVRELTTSNGDSHPSLVW